ncbi:MAG: hypothetical protein PHD51_00790 [Patescibacteria group bacterium]|nr:hypothetical protein [Patescibacteria group bacterium]MDD5490597.1 hypothetical protein [Patescibacteria group bacterium]
MEKRLSWAKRNRGISIAIIILGVLVFLVGLYAGQDPYLFLGVLLGHFLWAFVAYYYVILWVWKTQRLLRPEFKPNIFKAFWNPRITYAALLKSSERDGEIIKAAQEEISHHEMEEERFKREVEAKEKRAKEEAKRRAEENSRKLDAAVEATERQKREYEVWQERRELLEKELAGKIGSLAKRLSPEILSCAKKDLVRGKESKNPARAVRFFEHGLEELKKFNKIAA